MYCSNQQRQCSYGTENSIPDFDIATRNQLLDCGRLSWHEISPAIFGAMFQGAMQKDDRRTLGAHYTSEENILKIVKPLFLDKLYEEFEQLKKDTAPLQEKIQALPERKIARSSYKGITITGYLLIATLSYRSVVLVSTVKFTAKIILYNFYSKS